MLQEVAIVTGFVRNVDRVQCVFVSGNGRNLFFVEE